MKWLKVGVAVFVIITLLVGYGDPQAGADFAKTVLEIAILPFRIIGDVIVAMSRH